MMKKRFHFLLLAILHGGMSFSAETAPLGPITKQTSSIVQGAEYKIFNMSGTGLVAQVPQTPANMREAFSCEIEVSSIITTTDSTDAMGNPHLVTLVFSRPTGAVEATVNATGGLFPIYGNGLDRDKTDRFVLAINGDFYFLESDGFQMQTGPTGPAITEIISVNKLAGMAGDPNSEAKHQQIVIDYLNTINSQKDKIIADAIEKMRRENSLEGRDVTSIEFTSSAESITPGEKTFIGVVANLKDGSQLKTKGFSKGGTFWSDYKITVTGGTFENGYITTSTQFSGAYKDQVVLTIESVYHPNLKISKTFNINYHRNYYFSYAQDGMYGHFGNSGKDGNCVRGTSAGAGSDGSNGYDGTNAGEISVQIAPYKHAQTGEALLKYEISSQNGTEYFVVSPTSEVKINGRGGNGGSGGSGGQSGDLEKTHSAGESGDCDCAGTTMLMGQGGNGGNGGNGGDGATITVEVDPAVTEYNLVTIVDPGYGGQGGSGGDSDAADGCSSNSSVKTTKENLRGTPGQNGSNGQQGSVTINKTKVVLSW